MECCNKLPLNIYTDTFVWYIIYWGKKNSEKTTQENKTREIEREGRWVLYRFNQHKMSINSFHCFSLFLNGNYFIERGQSVQEKNTDKNQSPKTRATKLSQPQRDK